jgi:putative transposase
MLTLMVLLRSLGLICGGHQAIVLEHLALRHQLAVLTRTVKRPQLRWTDRLFWVILAKGWQGWRSALIVVQPDTVVRWHRQWLRRHWVRLSQRKHPGRPPMSSAIRALVRTMTTANPLWGAPRIHGELAKLGITVSERTMSRLLRRPRRPPSQTWRTFLTNHVATLVSMDFFTVPTLTGRVLFVLVLLSHQRRRIIHVNITEHPTAMWTAQQMIEAFPDDTAPRWLLRDRDAIYGDVFRRRVASLGIGEVVSSPSSPWQNPYAERLIGSIRRECLHLALEKDAPTPRRVQAPTEGRVVAFPEVGGLHHRYERRAA